MSASIPCEGSARLRIRPPLIDTPLDERRSRRFGDGFPGQLEVPEPEGRNQRFRVHIHAGDEVWAPGISVGRGVSENVHARVDGVPDADGRRGMRDHEPMAPMRLGGDRVHNLGQHGDTRAEPGHGVDLGRVGASCNLIPREFGRVLRMTTPLGIEDSRKRTVPGAIGRV